MVKKTLLPLAAMVAVALVIIGGCGRSKTPEVSYSSTPPEMAGGQQIDMAAAKKVAAEFFGVTPDKVKPAPEEYRYVRASDGSVGVVIELPGTEKAQCTVMADEGGKLIVTSASWFPPPEKVRPEAQVAGPMSDKECVALAKEFVSKHADQLKALGLPDEPTQVNAGSDKVAVVWAKEGGPKVEVEVARHARRVVTFTLTK